MEYSNIAENKTMTSFKVWPYKIELYLCIILFAESSHKGCFRAQWQKRSYHERRWQLLLPCNILPTQEEDYLVRSVISQAENLNKTIFSIISFLG